MILTFLYSSKKQFRQLIGRGLMLSIVLSLLISPITGAQNRNDGTVTLNFIDSNLEDVIKGVSAMTGIKFLVPPDLKSKKVNLVSDQPLPAGSIYSFLLTTLRTNRLTIVEVGGVNTIVPETDAWSTSAPITQKSAESKMVSKVFRFNNVQAATMANIIRPFLSQKGYPLVPETKSNSIIVVDYAQNIRNLETLINSIEESDNALPAIFPLTHISATDAVTSLNIMLDNATQTASSSLKFTRENITADIANNRLLIRADTERLAYISKLLAFIDVPRQNAGLIHIYQLKYANAETIAKTLSGILNATQQNTRPTATTSPTSTNPNQQGQQTTTTKSEGLISVKADGGVNIQADPSTNSIIVVAPDVVYRNVLEILQKLDVRRRQVFVEILIAEIQGEKSDEFSVQWLNAKGISDASNSKITTFGGTNVDTTSILDVAQNPAKVGKGLNLGVIKGTVTIPGVGQVLNLGMLARALETRLNANVLSSPTLMVLNNEESKLSVGANVPILTGQYTNTGSSTSSPFQTIERKDVGVSLKLKPQIMDSGVILLDINQEVSDILSISDQGPTTSKRSIDSRVLLDDGQTVVLGGLISDKINDKITKVPLLGDIPLIGGLFRSSTKEHKKSNLLLFIRPTILHDEKEVADLSRKKYTQIKEQMPYTGKDLRGIFNDEHVVLPSLVEPPKNFQTYNVTVPETSPTMPEIVRNEVILPSANVSTDNIVITPSTSPLINNNPYIAISPITPIEETTNNIPIKNIITKTLTKEERLEKIRQNYHARTSTANNN